MKRSDLAPLFTLTLSLGLFLFLASLAVLPFQPRPSATFTVTLLSAFMSGAVAAISLLLKRRSRHSKGPQ